MSRTLTFNSRWIKTYYWRVYEEQPMPPDDEACIEAMRATKAGREALILRSCKIVRMVLIKDFSRYLADARVRDMCSAAYAEVIAAVDSWEPGHGMKLTSWVYRKVYHSMARSAREFMRDDDVQMPLIHEDDVHDGHFESDDDEETTYAGGNDDRGIAKEPDGVGQRELEYIAEYSLLEQSLTDYERRLLDLLLDEYNSTEIGRLLGVSQSKAYRDIQKFLTKIRKKST